MSIRVKLLVIFLVLVLFSTGFLLTAGITLVAKGISEAYGAVANAEIDRTIQGAVDILAELKYAERHAPERLDDKSYMENLSAQINFYKGGLAVKSENQLIFSRDIPIAAEFIDQLEPLQLKSGLEEKAMHQKDEIRHISFNDKAYYYIDYSFVQPEGPITYYFVVDVSDIKHVSFGAQRSALKILGFLLVVIMGPLFYVLSKDIIGPAKVLEEGVSAISAGNLNVAITSKSKNELGRVIQYFDAMRLKLKGSIDAQTRMEENRKELLSSISHDLKTPITAIKGYVEGIRDGVANTPEKLDRYLQVIYDKSLYLDALIDDLFLFSKLDLQKLPFNKQTILFSVFFDRLQSQLKMSLTDENQQLSIVLGEGLDSSAHIAVQIDPRHMDRVFMNLLENCIKYADPHKEGLKVQLVANRLNDNVQIDIADNGLGISKTHLAHIFERFYRVDEARTSQNGTGLGLAISKQIVEQHGGSLSASSVEGEGTTLSILLPVFSVESGDAHDDDANS